MRQRLTGFIAVCALASFAAPVFANCSEKLAELRGQAQMGSSDGISKDGSLAPLEDADEDTGAGMESASGTASDSNAAGGENEIVKDGSETPLNTDLSNRATSGQEAEAQQEESSGTAAATTGHDSMSQEAQDLVARAEAALEAGDEAGCLEAVEEARKLP